MMLKALTPHKHALVFAVLGAFAAWGAAAETYTIDGAHTTVGFGVRHMTVSTVHGRFTGVSGTAEVDAEDLTNSSIEVTIDAASVDTANENRDNHLRSADFLDVENHPEIRFVSKAIEKSGDDYLVTGDLTIRGVTQEVQMPTTIAGPIDDPRGGSRMGIEAQLEIDRHDFEVNFSSLLDNGGLVVGNEVKITIGAELTAAPAAE